MRNALQGEGPAGAKVVGFRRPDGRYGACKRAWVRGDQRFAYTTAESWFLASQGMCARKAHLEKLAPLPNGAAASTDFRAPFRSAGGRIRARDLQFNERPPGRFRRMTAPDESGCEVLAVR